MRTKQPPYDTGKVKIGIYYAPDLRPSITYEEARIQNALLAQPIRVRPSRLRAFVNFILWR